MLIQLNPGACGMSAMLKWQRIKSKFESAQVHLVNSQTQDKQLISDALARGERTYIAAGGDGTVNFLLNTLITVASPQQLQTVRLGAIGLGSSNDFHKPFSSFIDGVPAAINVRNCTQRDVGFISAKTSEGIATRYFLINASIGISAEGNRAFNCPTGVQAYLKRKSTSLAISYAALRAILLHRNFSLEISADGGESFQSEVSQFSVLKNRHFSGTLRWGGDSHYDDGEFSIRLVPALGLLTRLQLMRRCSIGTADEMPHVRRWNSRVCIVSSPDPFTVEYDGEILRTTIAHFGILPQHLKVCGS